MKLEIYADLVITANRNQNLISRTTEADFWTRHLLDSAQLSKLMPADARTCLDVGSGAGLPGIVLLILTDLRITLVEPRRLRAEFLTRASHALGLTDRVEVVATKVEHMPARIFDVITARAFATLSKTINATKAYATAGTCWLLPKGRSAADEIAEASAHWAAEFETFASRTASDASIVRVSRLQGIRR